MDRAGLGGYALRTEAEARRAREWLQDRGLDLHPDPWKDWDQQQFIQRLESLPRSARVLDVGCASNPLLGNLARLGFTDLWGIDLALLPMDVPSAAVTLVHGDLLSAPFADGSFDAVTSLSVIEHGCPQQDYLDEAARLLKPGGLLLTSTDYWSRPRWTRTVPRRETFGLPWRIHSPRSLGRLRRQAGRSGFEPGGAWDLETQDAPILWNKRSYTFFFFELRKAQAKAAA